ncbi:MAG: glycosyltransferase family 4 protein [Cyanobacteriota bacterium]
MFTSISNITINYNIYYKKKVEFKKNKAFNKFSIDILDNFSKENYELNESDIYKKIVFIIKQAEELGTLLFLDNCEKISDIGLLEIINKNLNLVDNIIIFSNSEFFPNSNNRSKKEITSLLSEYNIAQNTYLSCNTLKINRNEFHLLTIKTNKKENNKINITWEGNQFLYNSLSVINRELELEILKKNNYNLAILPHDYYTEIKKEDYNYYDDLESKFNKINIYSDDFYIRNCLPENLPIPEKGYYILIFPWETGKIPENIINHINFYVDRVWCISNHVKNMLIEQNIIKSKLSIIPCGINSEIFNLDKIKEKIGIESINKLKESKKFKFLFVGGIIHRKGVDILIKAYLEEFNKNENVSLVIKTFGSKSYYKAESIIEKIYSQVDNKEKPEIIIINENIKIEDIPFLYSICDCYVQPYRAEGFGMPIAEAIACELPVIVTGFGPAKEFSSNETSFFIDYEIIQDYAEPNLDNLKKNMRYVFNNINKIKKKTKLSSKKIIEKLSWSKIFELIESDFIKIKQKKIYRDNIEHRKKYLNNKISNLINKNKNIDLYLKEFEILCKEDNVFFEKIADFYFYKNNFDLALEYYLKIEYKSNNIIDKIKKIIE